MNDLPINPSITDVLKACKFLKNRVRRTPTEYSRPLSDIAGAPVFMKLENQQLTGSFKIRGALYKMFSLSQEERANGVVTCSSGNHGQGVAMAAKELGVYAKIFVPQCCPETKKYSIKWRGGEFVDLIVTDGDFDYAQNMAIKYAAEHNMPFISCFEDAVLCAGQGSIGFEIFTDEPDIELLIVPAGGGCLINGIAIAAKALNPDVEIWGVQSEMSNPYVVSWNSGVVHEVIVRDSLADGLSGQIPQTLLSLAKKRVAGMAEVTEKQIAEAIAFMHREHHQTVEGAGAVGIAALLNHKINVNGRKTGVVISGGNIDDGKLLKIMNNYN